MQQDAPALTRAMNRLHARMSGLARGATGFVSQPEPRAIGRVARGRQLVAGNFHFAGFLVEGKGRSIWDIPVPDARFASALHGFGWLDDLAAAGDPTARARAQDWTFDWIARFGRGSGPGWQPDLAGRRLIRWVSHALFLLNGRSGEDGRLFFASLSRQTVFLSRRWPKTALGLPRFEALTGLIYAGLSLTGMERHTGTAIAALGRECDARIDADGAIATRNPEELLDILTLLTWAEGALMAAGRSPDPAHRAAIARIAPTLRALRHADGGLARFHGGGRGVEGRLDQSLAAAGGKAVRPHGLAMGFARLSAGRTTVIVDAAPPPSGPASANAHASTLAFEMTSGRRPMVVNCGSGVAFGPDWMRAGRATPSHSTLCVRGVSSSRIGEGRAGGQGWLTDVPDQVWTQADAGFEGQRLLAGHNGYVQTHGLTHVRQLDLSYDGRVLSGEDTLGAMTGADRRRHEAWLAGMQQTGVRFDLRFHLHPDADAAVDMGGAAVSIVLRSGEIWVFRHDGAAEMTLEPSVYLQAGRLRPRATRQIVLAASVTDYAFQIGWTFAKAQDTPQAIRDTRPDPISEDEDRRP